MPLNFLKIHVFRISSYFTKFVYVVLKGMRPVFRHLTNGELQPVAKMLRHLTRKTLLCTKHRIKPHISDVKQLPPPSPSFNVVPGKCQHDVLLRPTLRRERGGSEMRGPHKYL